MRRITTTTTLVAALLLATGCGGGDDDKVVKPAAQATTPSAATASKSGPPTNAPPAPATKAETGEAPAPGAAVPVPKPDVATQAEFVADLDAIDAAIVNGRADRAVSRGRDQCTSIKMWPNDQPKWVALTEQRFTTPNGPIGTAKAEQVLAIIRKHICPTF